MKHKTVREEYARDESIWLIYTRTPNAQQRIANLFKITKSRVNAILAQVADQKTEELNTYKTKSKRI